jgi:predicted alpha/beta hydrolase
MAAAGAPVSEDIHIVCADGRRLAGTAFRPAGAPLLAVQINPGTAVLRRLYRYYAAWLAAQGCLVLTFDNRGIGDSLGAAASHLDTYRFADWGAQDQAAASRWLIHHGGGAPLVMVSHSFGGTLMGLSPELSKARAAIAVASHYYRRHELSPAYRLRQRLDIHLRVPWRIWRTGGYSTPGIDFVMPPEAAREMARWQRRRFFFTDRADAVDKPHFGDLRRPLRHYIVSDDEMVPRRQGEALIQLYPHAQGENVLLTPEKVGLPQVGHFGFFRKSMPEALWCESLEWLRRAAG